MELYNLNNIKLVLNVIINYYLHIQSTMYLVLVLSQYIVDSIKQRVICITVFSQCPTWEGKKHIWRDLSTVRKALLRDCS